MKPRRTLSIRTRPREEHELDRLRHHVERAKVEREQAQGAR